MVISIRNKKKFPVGYCELDGFFVRTENGAGSDTGVVKTIGTKRWKSESVPEKAARRKYVLRTSGTCLYRRFEAKIGKSAKIIKIEVLRV